MSGENCQRCGSRSGLSAGVDDITWARLSGAAGGASVLCVWCMDALAAEIGIRGAVLSLHFAGRALASSPNSLCRCGSGEVCPLHPSLGTSPRVRR